MSKGKRVQSDGSSTASSEVDESRQDRFRRLAADRVSKAIQRIRMVGQLSNTQTYEYTTAQVDAIIQALTTEVTKVTDRFEGTGVAESIFSLPE